MEMQTTPQNAGDSQDTKACKACYTDIDLRAKRCPHCQAWQSFFFSPKGMATVLVPFIVLTTIVPLFFLFPIFSELPIFSKGEPFEGHRSGVTIIDKEMFFDSSRVIAMAKLRNETALDWEDFEIEAQFKDASGKTIDVARQNFYDMTLRAGDTTPFKLDTITSRPEDAYASVVLRIIKAKDAASPF